MANRLAEETSPYLLQHADNPVNWQPWDAASLAEAAERDLPLLVSIGYSACHWCHVMEHESFSDPAVAELMNRNFICIKVDREERPDIDALFMEACQMMTGHGGWPLNAFATPDGKPFWAGTYFPPVERSSMPSWTNVLNGIAATWRDQREEVLAAGERNAPRLAGVAALQPPEVEHDAPTVIADALESLQQAFDPRNGGFGGAPKFPSHEVISFLLAAGDEDMALTTLRRMADGGIHDQIGGGFSRYAVDATWTVPHFEKMLSDNALLASEYLHGWQVSGDPYLLRVCRSTLDWILDDLSAPEGGLYSALDADDPDGEGRYYAWSPELVAGALPDQSDAAAACEVFGITDSGNFEDGLSVPVRAAEHPELERLRSALLAARASRSRPATDTKVITSWNALAISALAEAGAVIGEPRYLSAAINCADNLLAHHFSSSGKLLRCRTAGRAVIPAVLEDHALLLTALLDLYEATFDQRWYSEAVSLADTTWERFGDAELGGFFTTAIDGEQLATRRKDLEDQPIPSGNASMALALTRLYGLSGESRHADRAAGVTKLLTPIAVRSPLACGRLLKTILIDAVGLREVAIVGPDSDQLIGAYRSVLRPTSVIAAATARSEVPLLANRDPVDGRASAFVCRNFTCSLPVTTTEELLEQLAREGA